MANKTLPSPCKADCPNRTATCKLECKRYKTYETLKQYQEKKKCEEIRYKEKNYISEQDKFAEWVKDSKSEGRNASNYLVR